ncbi:hypothetical protein GS504_02440 [Rhodococcus hoagii]|nr:hypothetical protein [Prescottella equi]NKS56447.1 hypothetical protein [Prescottella equi]NKS64817.1 hypothetical protein [Prescottella equi]NKS70908.1 hypothetical protein [Prescottella equi]NKS71961.1 hypothetical protein [Prescottella equi]
MPEQDQVCPFTPGTHRVEEIHAQLRSGSGVREGQLPDGSPVWIVAGYDAVTRLLADRKVSASKDDSTTGFRGQNLPPALDKNLLNIDGEQHRRVRSLAAAAFSGENAGRHRQVVAEEVAALLSVLPREGEVDLVRELCDPLPPRVIGRVLGLPADKLPEFREAARPIFAIDTSKEGEAIQGAMLAMLMLVAGVIEEKRAHPGPDLLSEWIAARDGGDRLSEEELLSLAFATIIGGFENVTALVGWTLDETIRHRSAAARASLNDPESFQSYVRATMGSVAPVNFALRRFPLEDITIGEVTIPKGHTVMPSLRSANSDPSREERPDLLFGYGRHFCIGSQLAEAEVSQTVHQVLARWSTVEPLRPRNDLALRPSWFTYALAELPVQVGGAAY